MSGELHVVGLRAFLRSLHGTPRNQSTGRRRLAYSLVGIETYLGAHRGRVVTKAELIDWLYCDDEEGGPMTADHILDVQVHHLRARGVPIETVWGVGWRIRERAA